MANMGNLLDLQCMMAVMMGIGVFLKKKGMISEEAKKSMTNLVISLFLPCSIINAFRISFDIGVLIAFGKVLLVAVMVQVVCLLISKLMYTRMDEDERAVMQYGTVCSNASFMGNPIAEGLYGSGGLLYASVYLIPMRIVMWTAGVACFTGKKGKREALKRVLVHPCIIALYIGLPLMLFQIELPSFLDQTIKSIGSCTTAFSMIIIGTILADVNPFSVITRSTLFYTGVRLFLIPLVVLVGCRIFHLDVLITGVSVILAAMPAGTTTGLLADRYDGNAVFASKCIILSTAASLLTTPFWCFVISRIAF